MALDFPNAPTLGQVYNGYTWDNEKWVAGGVISTPPGNAKKNYIVNGAMQISQENSTTPVAVGAYPVDMFCSASAGTPAGLNLRQQASPTPGGSPYRLRLTVTTGDSGIAPGDVLFFYTRIEGSRMSDLKFGTAAAKTITIQFGTNVKAGTYYVAVVNGSNNRGYTTSYTVTAGEALTDVVKSVTIPGDVTGTWATDNTTGLEIRWMLMAGTSYIHTANTWLAQQVWAGAGVNTIGITGNTIDLFDVSLTEGTVAPSYQLPEIASELAACRRYWQSSNAVCGQFDSSGTNCYTIYPFAGGDMRTSPSLVARGSLTNVLNTLGAGLHTITNTTYAGGGPSTTWVYHTATPAAAAYAGGYLQGGIYALNARL